MWRAILLMLVVLPSMGCRNAQGPDVYAGTTSTTVTDYPRAFDASKDVLREMGFELDRIDASAGVISTRPRTGSGLATPWIPSASPLNDLAHRNRRTALVRFTPADTDTVDDLRTYTGAIDVEWRIEIERVYVPGRRPSPTSVRLGGTWRDRDLPVDADRSRFARSIDTDEELATRALKSFLARLTPGS
ncbi:MAG: hypothetical protein Tsb0013_23540 [Phycisphaerales bacterium]